MNEVPISPDIWKLAPKVCTVKQMQVFTLRERHGYSWNQTCVTLNIDRRTARDHYAAATRNIHAALEQQRLEVDRERAAEIRERARAEPRPTSEGGSPSAQRRVTLRSDEPDHMPPNQAGP